mgnify:CR=1 FL=1
MANALGDTSKTKTLIANQLGTPSNHVAIAYIDSIQPAPPFNEDLQATCNIGFTTTTPIESDSLKSTNNVETTNGDLITTLGSVKAPIGSFEGAGVNSTADITTDTNVVATGNIEASGGNITCVAGIITSPDLVATNTIVATNDITCSTGDIIVSAGDFVATAGKAEIESNITTKAGNFTADVGNIVATAGGVLASVGNSQLNRIQYTTDYGGTDAVNTVALTNVPPYNFFSLPTGTHQLVLFATHASAGATSFPFEIHNLPSDCLRDYTLQISSQTYDNGGGSSLGFNNVVVGEAVSAPTDTTKCSVFINVQKPYVAQKMKFNVRFEYSPSP